MSRENAVIATRLARAIFECGDTKHDKTQRLQLKGGHWPNGETDLGGFNEVALAAFIADQLNRVLKHEPTSDKSGDDT